MSSKTSKDNIIASLQKIEYNGGAVCNFFCHKTFAYKVNTNNYIVHIQLIK